MNLIRILKAQFISVIIVLCFPGILILHCFPYIVKLSVCTEQNNVHIFHTQQTWHILKSGDGFRK